MPATRSRRCSKPKGFSVLSTDAGVANSTGRFWTQRRKADSAVHERCVTARSRRQLGRGMSQALLRAYFRASLTTDAVERVHEIHDHRRVVREFIIVVTVVVHCFALDELKHVARAHLEAPTTANALALIEPTDEGGRPLVSSMRDSSDYTHCQRPFFLGLANRSHRVDLRSWVRALPGLTDLEPSDRQCQPRRVGFEVVRATITVRAPSSLRPPSDRSGRRRPVGSRESLARAREHSGLRGARLATNRAGRPHRCWREP